MKKIALLTIAAMSLLLGGCDDKLNIPPKEQLVLSTVEEYAALLDKRYLLLYDTQLPWGASFDAGNYTSTVVGNDYLFDKVNYLGLDTYNRMVDFKTTMLYTYCYQRIARYNIIIDNVDDAIGSEGEKRKAKAEALLLRAYNYFVLVNTFSKHYNKATAHTDGGLLIRTKFSLEEDPAQSSVADVYKQIEGDIAQAMPSLGAFGINVNHPGLAFAYALLAKVHLFKQEFDKAEEAALKSLNLNRYLFDWVAWDQGGKPVPEIGYNNEENLYFGYGTGMTPSAFIGPHLVKKYGKGDLRKERFFWNINTSALDGCFRFRGYVDVVNGLNVTRSYKVNVGGMRVSEVMLMLAECYARSGKVSEAMALVNEIRAKRILPESYVPLVAANKQEAFNHVMDERSRELVLTANNFYDIRRLEVEGIHQSVDRVLPDGTTYTVRSNSHVFVMPFPQEAIDRSVHLKQNVDK